MSDRYEQILARLDRVIELLEDIRDARRAKFTEAEQAAEHLVKTMEAMTMTEEEITTALLRAGGQEQP